MPLPEALRIMCIQRDAAIDGRYPDAPAVAVARLGNKLPGMDVLHTMISRNIGEAHAWTPRVVDESQQG